MAKEDDTYGIRELFQEIGLETPEAQVLRKSSRPLALRSREEKDEEIPAPLKERENYVSEWINTRTTPDIGNRNTIYEDLYEILVSIEPLLALAKNIPNKVRNDFVLYSLGGDAIRVKDLKRLRNVEIRIRLVSMAVQQLEARVNSSTEPGFPRKVGDRDPEY